MLVEEKPGDLYFIGEQYHEGCNAVILDNRTDISGAVEKNLMRGESLIFCIESELPQYLGQQG